MAVGNSFGRHPCILPVVSATSETPANQCNSYEYCTALVGVLGWLMMKGGVGVSKVG